MRDEWIDVNDEMPTQDGRYLVYEQPYGWIGVSSLRKGIWDLAIISHWMNLPEPPK